MGDGRAYTIEQRRGREVVTCYDLATGHELWGFGYDAHFQEVLGGPGPRATPTLDGDYLYALGAAGDLHCLEARAGKLIWHVNILRDNDAENLHWGMCGSPLVDGDRVIVTPGGSSGGSVVAYDRSSGQPVWRAGDRPTAYASPMIVTLAGQRQLLVFGGAALSAHALDDGHELWSYPWVTDQGINVCQPIVIGDDRVFISSGYGHGCALLHLAIQDDEWAVKRLWATKTLKAKFASAVLYDGYIYGLDEAVLLCLDAATGQRCWKGGRYGYGQLVLVGNSLVILAENGDLVRVRATPERYQELSRFQAVQGKTWNHPAVAGSKLLVRNSREMACFELPLE
jgi:outer membrane protein assembly factor BamB